jgi:hypothetical protein
MAEGQGNINEEHVRREEVRSELRSASQLDRGRQSTFVGEVRPGLRAFTSSLTQ